MKKITFLIIVFTSLIGFGQTQVYNQTYESLTVGDPSTSSNNQIEGGTGTVQVATASGNTSQVLKAIHDGGVANMYVRSGNFGVAVGDVINASFDVATSNAVYTVTIRYTNNDNYIGASVSQPDSPATVTNGTHVSSDPNGKITSVTTNTFGTCSVTFTVPSGFNAARVQIYQYGAANTMEVDNWQIEKTAALSITDLQKFSFTASPNPATDYISLSAAKPIKNIEVYNLLGQQVINKNLNSTRQDINVSNLSKGVYILKAFIEDAAGTYKFVKQ